MAPKKAQKMSLNDFLTNETLGSWADEMDSLPTAPSFRPDDGSRNRAGERDFSRQDSGFSSRSDRQQYPPRDEVPMPTEPPFTAFIGNLPFDLTEQEIEEHFGPNKIKAVKIIRDRDEKPKGFGYVEFEDIAGLKDAMSKTGTSLAGRTIRVSVAEPPKERVGGFDDSKFSGNWRREGPLPPDDRGFRRTGTVRDDEKGYGSRFAPAGPLDRDIPPSLAETSADWRSSKPSPRLGPALIPAEGPMKRRSSGFSTPTDGPGLAETEEVWTIGSKFKRSPPASVSGVQPRKFSAGRGEMGPPAAQSAADEGDWRSSSRRPSAFERSPTNSTPPTPQLGRRKLELLPRSSGNSNVPSPMASPKFGNVAPTTTASRPNPFGAAKPIDVSAREKEVAERLEKERREREESLKDRRISSRPTSRAPSERAHSPSPAAFSTPPTPRFASSIRPTVSFASAARAKPDPDPKPRGDNTDEIANGVQEITV